MAAYADTSTEELRKLKVQLDEEYAQHKAKGLSLNMARGKPASAQLDLSMPMLDLVNSESSYTSKAGDDCRNYGVLDGLAEAKELMAIMLDDTAENTLVFGNSSLNIMYDTLLRCYTFGTLGATPWGKLEKTKWLCPAPGYDRHFSITESFGIEMITVPMTETGPDMDVVEALVANDSAVKGIWCVPKYSNPDGITYSDETVQRLAAMPCASEDFRIFWDNAYSVHHLYDKASEQDQVLDIGRACQEAGNPHRYFKFASTSKVTFPGSGISAMATSEANIADTKKCMSMQTIGHDKLNQLRHVRFLVDSQGIATHMSKHAEILRPKFELVCRKLADNLEGTGCGTWNEARGGYFISFNAMPGTASRVVSLAKEAGVVMTGAGATYPYGKDPHNSNIRIAPTLPPLEELEKAMDIFVCCVKLACIEKLLEG
ncbi:MAG: aminotransferase class I/II-fold pyridoxal phosphate-dependent enzyme [Raoultibacter sp.]|jgi:aspartate/methionine/tyrosine aminotransferase